MSSEGGGGDGGGGEFGDGENNAAGAAAADEKEETAGLARPCLACPCAHGYERTSAAMSESAGRRLGAERRRR